MDHEKTQQQLGLDALVEVPRVQQSGKPLSETEKREAARKEKNRKQRERMARDPELRARAYEKQREWTIRNRDKSRATQARYRAKPGFKEKNAAKSRNFRAKNKEKMREYARIQRLKPSHIIARRKSHIKRKAAIRGATISPQSIDQFVALVKSKKRVRCYYCKKLSPTSTIHFDHIIAVSRGGHHSVENLCVACPECNVRKSNHSIDQWNKISTNKQPVLPI